MHELHACMPGLWKDAPDGIHLQAGAFSDQHIGHVDAPVGMCEIGRRTVSDPRWRQDLRQERWQGVSIVAK